jgi:hypothetical protein
MMHFLLIVLILFLTWRLLSHKGVNGAALVCGLRRLALVLAITGASLGGLIGYYANAANAVTGMLAGIAIGFTLVWFAAATAIWVIRGFLK